jgi:ClpP class serine protease
MAKALGLVDELGGLDEAIRLAGELGGVPGKPRIVRPRRAWRLADLADLVGGESALSWLRSAGWSRPALSTLPLFGSSKLPLYLLD